MCSSDLYFGKRELFYGKLQVIQIGYIFFAGIVCEAFPFQKRNVGIVLVLRLLVALNGKKYGKCDEGNKKNRYWEIHNPISFLIEK